MRCALDIKVFRICKAALHTNTTHSHTLTHAHSVLKSQHSRLTPRILDTSCILSDFGGYPRVFISWMRISISRYFSSTLRRDTSMARRARCARATRRRPMPD